MWFVWLVCSAAAGNRPVSWCRNCSAPVFSFGPSTALRAHSIPLLWLVQEAAQEGEEAEGEGAQAAQGEEAEQGQEAEEQQQGQEAEAAAEQQQ